MPESRSINNEGVKVHYLDWGGDSPAAVLLHPSSFCADIWGPAAQVMSPFLRCISMDLRGHGGSGPPPGPFSWDDLAGDLVALLDALDLRDCLVVGHSRGGGVSLLATAAPGKGEVPHGHRTQPYRPPESRRIKAQDPVG